MGCMSTQTITEFLEARIAEDEATATRGDAAFVVPEALAWSILDPARALAECAAKRAIIAGIIPERDPQTGTPDYDPLWVIRALAAVYADHPAYRQEWAL